MSIGKRPAGLHFQDERISAIIVTSLGFRVLADGVIDNLHRPPGEAALAIAETT
jgi:hypothetical protein